MRTIDADALKELFPDNGEGSWTYNATVKAYIDAQPTIEPDIIRCKDCKHSRFFDPCFYCYEMGGEIIVPENGFCFKAERRENETD